MRATWCGLLLASFTALAQPAPEECLAFGRDAVVDTVSYGGREYRFRRSGCKALFESDPERFAQLFDALIELRAAGEGIDPASPSLVPS